MDSWPYDDRNAPSSGYKPKHAATDYPSLQQGMVGAVTLAGKDNRLEWSYLRNTNEESVRRWRSDKPFKIFPETRPPLPPKPQFGSKLSAQHGANFIRTCMPEADIPAELIREQLEDEDARLSQVQDLDPYVGNLLVSGVQQETTDNAIGFIAFPMGEVLSDLNVSTLSISKQTGMVIKPVSGCKREFSTPIQQIVTAPLDKDHALAVRTYDSTNFLLLNKPSPQSTWSVEDAGKLTLVDTNRREVVDIKLRSEQVVLVNEHGSLYTSRPFTSRSKVTHLSDMSADPKDKDPYFWRIAFDLDPNGGYVVSSDTLSIFDMRGGTPQKYFELKTPGEFFTSVEDCGAKGIVCLCSSNQIYWFDRRNMRSPLLSVRHYRQFDRELSTRTIGGTSTFLTSRKNNMVSIYDMSHSEDQLLHIRDEPFGVLPPFPHSECIGQSFVSSPFLPEASHAVLLKLSKRGSISGCCILANDMEDDYQVVAKYTTALQAIASRSWKPNELLFEQESIKMNLFPVYDSLFRKNNDTIDKKEEDEAPQVYDLVEGISDYFQQPGVPSEQMLTTYDVAFRAGDEPKDPSRSDFLTGSVMNSRRGLRALRKGRLDPNSLAPKAPWHMDLAPTLTRLGLIESPSDDSEGKEPFSEFDLRDSDQRTVESVRLERRHREQLEVDLRLSRNVFSTQAFEKSAHTLETMTEALSLAGAPPDVEFGFLHPVKKTPADNDKDDGDLGLGLGVKLLLKDWDIGADTADYTYRDPYSASESRPAKVAPKPVTIDPTPVAAPPQLLTQKELRPPAVGVLSQPAVLAPPKAKAQSQLLAPGGYSQTQSSQDAPIASTQVLRGPFGGRPTKKKTEKKKRMGGF